MPLPHIEDVLLYSLAQDGDRYVFGAEVPLKADDSGQWDCSELVEWSCGKAGVTPRVPDGAYWQWRHSWGNGGRITVDEGVKTRGALLFVGDGTGTGRDAITHVAWSLGDGRTIEARGSKWGVGSWPSAGRFDFAGLVPGVDYSAGHGRLDPWEDGMALSNEALQQIAAVLRSEGVSGADGAADGALANARIARRLARYGLERDGVDADTIKRLEDLSQTAPSGRR